MIAAKLGTVLVIAKQPIPGRVKTRLTPPFTPVQAATLARAALTDTLREARRIPADRHVLVLQGDPRVVDAPGWRVIPQVAGGLDARLTAAFRAVVGDGPAVLVGMDTPQLVAAQISAFRPWEFDACIGPAVDGGYWAIGFADPAQAQFVIPGVPMSTSETGSEQRRRLDQAGLTVQSLDELTDVDTAESARRVAEQAPLTEFSRVLHRMRPSATPRTNLVYAQPR